MKSWAVFLAFLAIGGAPCARSLPSPEAASDADADGSPPQLKRRASGPAVVVHGGAGDIYDDELDGRYAGTAEAVRAAFRVLDEEGGSAADAVVAAVRALEDDPNFNAGRGSALTTTGHVENDASLMLGGDLNAGSVAAISGIKNPIEGARAVLEDTPHVQLAGQEATDWLIAQGLETEDEDYFITDSQYEEWLEWLSDHGLEPPSSSRAAREDDDDSAFLHSNGDFHLRPYPAALRNENKWSHQKGTVGAVALDAQGNIAAGTSTGGLMGKMPGRVGDTPGVGHGVFADDQSAGVSCTGEGEAFMKTGIARRVASNAEAGASASQAIEEALRYMVSRLGSGEGGAIAITPDGEIGIGWNSKQMSWAYGRDGKVHYGANVGDDFEEDL